jgi:hypothetical protein
MNRSGNYGSEVTMLADLDSILNAYDDGSFAEWQVLVWTVKKLALNGSKEDYQDLPTWLKNAIATKIEQVFRDGQGWMTIGSKGEDMMPYAMQVKDRFLQNELAK